MRNETKKTMIVWLKRMLGMGAIVTWVYIIYTISTSTLAFDEQVPYCMGSTMLIFTLLSAAFKGLEYWQKQDNSL